MDTEPLSYPVASWAGRRAVLAVAGGLVALAITFQYTAVLVDSVVGVVPLVSGVIVVWVLVGYCCSVLASTGTEPPTPSIGKILRTGTTAIVVGGGLLVVPIVLLVTTVAGVIESGIEGGTTGSILLLFSSTSALFLFLAVAYVLPAVFARIGEGADIRTALVLERLLPILRETDYLLWWTAGFTLVVLAVGLLAITIQSSGIAGLVAAVGAAYLGLAGTRAFARGYAESSETR